MSEKKITRKKSERSNEILCLTVASGISEIIRFSVDENFRKESFRSLNVESTSNAEKEIYKKLLTITKHTPLISHNFTPVQGKGKGNITFVKLYYFLNHI